VKQRGHDDQMRTHSKEKRIERDGWISVVYRRSPPFQWERVRTCEWANCANEACQLWEFDFVLNWNFELLWGQNCQLVCLTLQNRPTLKLDKWRSSKDPKTIPYFFKTPKQRLISPQVLHSPLLPSKTQLSNKT